jgi:hypothetical protein
MDKPYSLRPLAIDMSPQLWMRLIRHCAEVNTPDYHISRDFYLTYIAGGEL